MLVFVALINTVLFIVLGNQISFTMFLRTAPTRQRRRGKGWSKNPLSHSWDRFN